MKGAKRSVSLPKLAVLNLGRYRKRTMITAGAIAYGIMMLIATRSLLDGANQESETNLRLYETATGRIMAPGYWDDRETLPLETSFDPALAAPLLEESGASWSPRIRFGGDLIFYKDPFPEDGVIPGQFTAIDPRRDGEVFRLRDSLVEGEWLRDGEMDLVIGHWLAEDIGAQVGHFITLETRTIDGYVQAVDLDIVGIINCPNPEVTRSGMFLPLSVADEYLEMDGRVTEINISFGNTPRADDQFAAIVPAVNELGLDALDWRTLGADFFAVSKGDLAGSAMIVILILVIAAVGISNTMLMAVYERARELGMMRALGMKDRQVRVMFLWEAAGIGFLGGFQGMVLGALVNWPLTKWGLDYSKLLRDSSFGYRIQGQFYGIWDVPGMIVAMLCGVALTVLVALFSTHRILRMDIPASLRFQ